MSSFDYGSKKEDGQYERHPTVVPEDRKFIRPVRRTYKHVGVRPQNPTRPLTAEEQEQNKAYNYVAYEEYGPERSPLVGRFWTQKQLDSGCNTTTTMGVAIAETYAATPAFYGRTFCCNCRDYFPVGEAGEFVWISEDGRETSERVGT